MKKFYFLALAAIMGLCVSCGSDDTTDTTSSNEVVEIKAPEKSADATSFKIPAETVTATAQKILTDEGQEISASLTGVNITESGKAIFEVTTVYDNGSKKLKYVTYDAELNGNTYTVKDGSKVIGKLEKVQVSASRASSSISINITVTINIPGIGEITFVTDNPVVVTEVVDAIVSSVTTVNLARTWAVERMKLTLVFDDKSKTDASRTENSGNLHNFIELAENNGVNLTDNDKRQLDKSISGITIDKNGLLCLTYSDGVTDAASWSWTSQTDPFKIRINLKDGDMGNKFLKDNSIIEVQFPGNNKCILILSTRLEEDKCTASLLINLK